MWRCIRFFVGPLLLEALVCCDGGSVGDFDAGPTCRCIGDIEGFGRVDVACGGAICMGGVGFRCTEANSGFVDPSACEELCRCIGDIDGVGHLDVACGETTCIGTFGFRCVEANSGFADPAVCDDAGATDGGLPPDGTPLFGSCSSDSDCMAGLECPTTYPLPFCTHDCTSDGACAPGVCLNAICVPPCVLGALDCDRYGAACAPDPTRAYCAPTCEATEAMACDDGLVCDRWWGECYATLQSRGPDIGAPCTDSSDCRTGLCIGEVSRTGRPTGFVGGMCVGFTRSPGPGAPDDDSGCPPGSVPELGSPEGDVVYCVPACATNEDCRPGYFCGPTTSMPRFCAPIDCDLPGVPACPAGTSCQSAPGSGIRSCVACVPACSGRACGTDGCGGSCGTCAGASSVCNETTGTCECTGETDAELCAAASAECGSLAVTDRCGVSRSVSCGTCVAPASCGGVAPNQCDCVPESDAALCTAAGAACGEISRTDRCGASRMVSCGTCVAPASCGILMPNRCGCIGETAPELCAARGAECGALSAPDRCGVGRSVSCGSCTLPETCAGAGTPNTCGICTPSCGSRVCGNDGCGGSCGTCGAGLRCNAAGACEPIPCDPVANTLCGSGLKCDWTGSATACIAAGSGRAGDSCFNPSGCAGQHTCSAEGFCREWCNFDSDCVSGDCDLPATGTPYRFCSRPCDPTYQAWLTDSDGCSTGQCRILDGEVTDCGETGASSSSCSTTGDCRQGYACQGARCRQVCEIGGAPCTGATCTAVPGWFTYGVCR